MDRRYIVLLAAVLIVALAMPAAAGTAHGKKGIRSGISNFADQTEGLISGCFKTCFGFFNPCLDIVKGCTDIVLSPLDQGFGYVERAVYKPRYVRRSIKKKKAVPK